MDIQYVCELYFHKKSDRRKLMQLALQSLGFMPNMMSIYVNLDEMYEEVCYDEDLLFSVLSRESDLGITISQQTIDESISNIWFRITKTEGAFFSLRWSNDNMDFLLTENIKTFLTMDGFGAGYVFNNKDAWSQTQEAEKGNLDAMVYPGQFRYVCGLQFMAAPLMWFGISFFKIITKNKLLEFKGSYSNESLMPNIVVIKLFDIYKSPAKFENRENQKRFWSFFSLEKVISKYEEDNVIDPVQSLKDFLARRR